MLGPMSQYLAIDGNLSDWHLVHLGQFAIGEVTSYTITASAGANGTISPSGAITIKHGRSITFTFTPIAHYHVGDVLVDGVSVGAPTSYTLSSVTASHTISVSFAIDVYPVNVVLSGLGTVTRSPNQAGIPYHSILTLTAVMRPGTVLPPSIQPAIASSTLPG